MKNFTKFLFAAFALAAAASCDPANPEDTRVLTLEPDKTSILANGTDAVTLTVKLGDEDVTSAAKILRDGTEISGNVFTSVEPGAFKLTAQYSGKTSAAVTVNVAPVIPLVLTVDKPSIKGNGTDAATFTVMQGEENVTEMVFVCGTGLGGICLPSNVFTSDTPGTYEFNAYFKEEATDPNHAVSNSVTITVEEIASAFDASKVPHKNVSFFIFTSSGCAPCYAQKTYVFLPLEEEYGDHFVPINLYSFNINGSGIVATATTGTFESELQAKGHSMYFYPNPIIDLTTYWDDADIFNKPTQATTYNEILERARPIVETFIAKPAKTGIAVDSSVNGDKLNVEVSVGAKEAGAYQVGVFLIEDHVSCVQAGYGSNYDHKNVLRKSAATSIFGEALGTMDVGETVSKTYSFDILSNYAAENLSIIAYTLYQDNGNWVVTNCVKAPASGLTDFKYAE